MLYTKTLIKSCGITGKNNPRRWFVMHLCPRKFSAYNISRARVTTCWNQLNVSLCKVWMSQQTWGSWSGMDVVIDTSCVNCGTWDLVAFRYLKTDNQLYSLLQTSNLKLHRSYLMFWIIDWVAILESINFLASCRPVYVLKFCMFSFISLTWCWSLQLCSDFSTVVYQRETLETTLVLPWEQVHLQQPGDHLLQVRY